MTKLLVLPVVLVVACADKSYPNQRELPTDPVETTEVATVPGEPLLVATGGTQGFAIAVPATVGFSGEASEGFAIEPAGNIWPNIKEQTYYMRALVSGTGSFEVQTNHGIASGLVDSADLATLAIVPADYRLDGTSAFALDTNRLDIQIVLRDAQARRLVDATLGIADGQTAWDRATRPAIVGAHLVTVYADSFGDRVLGVNVVDAVDRIERRNTGDVTCFHAYAGAIEVASAMAITGGTPVPGAANCATGAVTSAARL